MILTDQEIDDIGNAMLHEGDYFIPIDFARAIEKAILKKIGKPVCYHYVDCCGVGEDMFGHPDGYYPSDATPLYKLPEVGNES